jgi:hypothetical protein
MVTTLHTAETPVQADTQKKLLNRKIAKKYRQEAGCNRGMERSPQNLGRIQRQMYEGSGGKF